LFRPLGDKVDRQVQKRTEPPEYEQTDDSTEEQPLLEGHEPPELSLETAEQDPTSEIVEQLPLPPTIESVPG
jgi:hypothetical protein